MDHNCPRCNKAYPFGDPRALLEPPRMCFDCEQTFLSVPHVKAVVDLALKARRLGGHFYVKFTCLHCGSRQTIDNVDAFHPSGQCEECKGVSDFSSPSVKLGLLFLAGTPVAAIDAILKENDK